MAYSINTNITSLQAQEYLRTSSEFQSKTINRVTSGLRIVSSGDDAAGLAIANSLRSDRSVLTQGIRNANDGLSTLQTIDGGINNISQLLDRARTLAAQSASGTFEGNRNVLNSEFQSVISEIDRQAQAIGLDQGGSFAKNLTVFIGGGRSNSGISEISNGSVSVDLSQSTVDAKSLGLKGVQAVGKTETDIGTGSATTSVGQILANQNNIDDLTTANYTQFKFFGPGFGDGDGVAINVNIQGVTDETTLVTAINAAIESSGNGGSTAATAFKNAGIVASVNTDDAGRKQLAFSSSSSAFQVKANDKMANALMGNFNGATAEGASMTTTVTAGAATASLTTEFGTSGAGNIVFRFQGAGMTSAKDITVAVSADDDINDAFTDLSTQVVNDSTLRAAGISVERDGGTGKLVFSSTRGEKFDVQVSGDKLNRLGFGSFMANADLNNAFDYTTITGTNYTPSTAVGDATFEFSINGAASSGNSITVSLDAGDAEAAVAVASAVADAATWNTSLGNELEITVDDGTGSGPTTKSLSIDPDALGTQASLSNVIDALNASVVTEFGSQVATFGMNTDGKITLTTTAKGSGATVAVADGGANSLSRYLNLEGQSDTGLSRTGSDMADALNQAFAQDTEMAAAGLKASFSNNKLTVESTNGTYFRLNTRAERTAAYDAGSVAGTVDGTGQLDFSGTDDNLFTIAVDGGDAVTFTLDTGTQVTIDDVISDITSQAATAELGITASKVTVVDKTAAEVEGSTNIGTQITLVGGTDDDLDITINGTTYSNIAHGLGTGATNVSAIVTALQSDLDAATGGVRLATFSWDAVNEQLTVTSTATGADADITIVDGGVAGSLSRVLGLTVAADASDTGATTSSEYLKISTTSTGTGSSLEFANVGVGDAATRLGLSNASNGTAAHVGFNDLGSAYTASVVGPSPSAANQVNAGGSWASNAFDFTALAYGNDDQTLTISANDSAGVQQTKSIVIKNDADDSRNGRNIDQVLDQINSQLQQSNNPTLQKIVAVKVNTGVTTDIATPREQIQFLSNEKFQVSLSATPSENGIGTDVDGVGTTSVSYQGTTKTAAALDGGSSAAIDTQAGGEAAVSALANAVKALGEAQAVVGKGQNRFNFAVSLASTQLTNLAASESRIRDADLAMEAANLTKAQILQQAGIAALAQANSAPQQVMSLLRG